MNIFKHITDGLPPKRIAYVLLWSAGLFAASFYTFCGKFNFAAMSVISDALHEMNANNRQFTPVYFGCFIFFILSTIFSILVNNVLFGWILFIVAWMALTVLKASMLWDVKGVKIDH